MTATPSLQYPSIAHQRLIREGLALEPEPFIEEKRALATSLKNSVVREISKLEAKEIILKHEYLGNMGTSDYAFGLYFGRHLAGAVCFGRTAGTRTAASICGKEFAHLVKTLNRGACVHWTHTHSPSFLISHACRLMTQKGYHIFVGYADPAAGEIGTIYQACGWNYCGTASASSSFVWAGKPVAKDRVWGTFKNGRLHDERNIHHAIRRGYRIECTRHQKRLQMIREGFVFLKSQPKHRYVGFYGDKQTVTTLWRALKWETFPSYPKRPGRTV